MGVGAGDTDGSDLTKGHLADSSHQRDANKNLFCFPGEIQTFVHIHDPNSGFALTTLQTNYLKFSEAHLTFICEGDSILCFYVLWFSNRVLASAAEDPVTVVLENKFDRS